jgi:hypothetical protein
LRASDEEIRVEVSDADVVGFCTEHVTIVILRPAGIATNVGRQRIECKKGDGFRYTDHQRAIATGRR